jgi:multidrug resistance efflux pump
MAVTASVVSLAIEDLARAENAAWMRFSTARDRGEFCTSWLAILCTQIDGVNGALLLLGPDQEGAFAPAAMWPDPSRDLRHLGATAQRTLMERKGMVVAADGQSGPIRDQAAHIGYPIEVASVLHGAVVLDVAPSPEAALQRSLRLVHWASAWLIDQFRLRMVEERDARLSRVALAMDMVATVVKERRFAASALSVANELSARLRCDRVSIGLEKSGAIAVRAISNTAVFDAKMSLVRTLGAAMDEVLDLDTTIVFPPRDCDPLGAAAHAELAADQKCVAVCSVPLREDGHTTGVLTLERTFGDAFDGETVSLCETIGTLLGPILGLKQDNERSTWRRIWAAMVGLLQVLFGPRHAGAKLVALVLVGLVSFFTVFTTTYRVSARTVVEGAVQRAAVAPFDGHIADSNVRAGDTVRAGQVLCRLDDRDLKLDLARLISEREQLYRKHRQALATQDRGNMMVLAAQIAQTEAQLALVTDRIARATLRAPFDGVVVSGDLSQLLGTPVEQGKLLFQIAPLDAYRVILEVDERDIADLEPKQSGELMLSGLPGQAMPFAVHLITPVSTAKEGRNFFQVEAQLTTPSDRLRPGMEGVGKIVVGERRLIWIWTHGLIDWLRIWAWKMLP